MRASLSGAALSVALGWSAGLPIWLYSAEKLTPLVAAVVLVAAGMAVPVPAVPVVVVARLTTKPRLNLSTAVALTPFRPEALPPLALASAVPAKLTTVPVRVPTLRLPIGCKDAPILTTPQPYTGSAVVRAAQAAAVSVVLHRRVADWKMTWARSGAVKKFQLLLISAACPATMGVAIEVPDMYT